MQKRNKKENIDKAESVDEGIFEASETDVKQDTEETDAEATRAEETGAEETGESEENTLADEVNPLQEALDKALDEIESLKDSRLRLLAEYDNYKRRTQKEKERIYADSVVDVSEKWLPIIDNLERAAAAADTLDEQSDMEAITSVADGIDLIRKQADETMAKIGIVEIDCLNKAFDPELHEAVMRVDSDEHNEETVVEVFAKGYTYKDRVIRHAVVKVAN